MIRVKCGKCSTINKMGIKGVGTCSKCGAAISKGSAFSGGSTSKNIKVDPEVQQLSVSRNSVLRILSSPFSLQTLWVAFQVLLRYVAVFLAAYGAVYVIEFLLKGSYPRSQVNFLTDASTLIIVVLGAGYTAKPLYLCAGELMYEGMDQTGIWKVTRTSFAVWASLILFIITFAVLGGVLSPLWFFGKGAGAELVSGALEQVDAFANGGAFPFEVAIPLFLVASVVWSVACIPFAALTLSVIANCGDPRAYNPFRVLKIYFRFIIPLSFYTVLVAFIGAATNLGLSAWLKPWARVIRTGDFSKLIARSTEARIWDVAVLAITLLIITSFFRIIGMEGANQRDKLAEM